MHVTMHLAAGRVRHRDMLMTRERESEREGTLAVGGFPASTM